MLEAVGDGVYCEEDGSSKIRVIVLGKAYEGPLVPEILKDIVYYVAEALVIPLAFLITKYIRPSVFVV